MVQDPSISCTLREGKDHASTYELITEWRAKVVRCLVSLFGVPHLAEADACEPRNAINRFSYETKIPVVNLNRLDRENGRSDVSGCCGRTVVVECVLQSFGGSPGEGSNLMKLRRRSVPRLEK